MQGKPDKGILDPIQKDVLNAFQRNSQKPFLVTGFAGTGKTVLLVYAIEEALAINSNLSICVVVYTHSLIELVRSWLPEYLHEIPIITYFKFLKSQQSYDVIVVDEVQDLPIEVIPELKRRSRKLIVAGDNNQSIYSDRVSPTELSNLLDPEIKNLTILHRMTEKVRNIVQTILPDTGLESARMGRMANVEVVLAKAQSLGEEVKWIWAETRRRSKVGSPSALLFPHKWMIESFINIVCEQEGISRPEYPVNRFNSINYGIVNSYLAENGLPIRYLGSGYGSLYESDERPLTYIMTYHSAKGLDFSATFLPFLNSNLQIGHSGNVDLMDRRIFFVASTRSRKELFYSYSQEMPHAYIQNMPQQLLKKIPCTIAEQREQGRQIIDF